MRLGMFMMPVHPPARSFTETLAEDTEKSLLADRLSFEEFWLGEHFSASSEPIPSPLMFMAGLLPRTKNLRFGTDNLPNHDPAIVAAEVAQFDHMSKGRFTPGIGPGGLLSDFELFGNTDPVHTSRRSCKRPGKTRIFMPVGIHLENPAEKESDAVRPRLFIVLAIAIGFLLVAAFRRCQLCDGWSGRGTLGRRNCARAHCLGAPL